MIKLKEAVIVEGIYDKLKLSPLIDAPIITTDGFALMKNPAKQKLIKSLAESVGIIILTDSDRAGFRIRNYLKKIISLEHIKHAYIPDVPGKEKRKSKPSKDGLLGVEGIDENTLTDILSKAGCTVMRDDNIRCITKQDFYSDGLSGSPGSRFIREKLCERLALPKRISSNSLLEILNRLYTYDGYKKIVEDLKKTCI